MSRILEPAEIQVLSYSAIPRLRLPNRTGLFATRANRLRALAKEREFLSGYLRIMAELVDAQQEAINGLTAPLIAPEVKTPGHALGHPLPARMGRSRHTGWKDVLYLLIKHLRERNPNAPNVNVACTFLACLDDSTLEQIADNILTMSYGMVDSLSAPIVTAALQVAWVDAASRLNEQQVPYPDTSGSCPVCGTTSLASTVRIGGKHDGYRFVVCGLCATESHVVRVKCTSCESTRGISYQLLDGEPDWAKAESCDECHTYRKIFYQGRQHDVEPFADDLATLELDLAMNDAGYRRPAVHPFLWPSSENTVPMQ